MSKLVNHPIKVTGEPLPKQFYWQGRRYTIVEILDQWWDTGCWWQGEIEKFFLRVVTADNSMVELYRQQRQWHLYKIYD